MKISYFFIVGVLMINLAGCATVSAPTAPEPKIPGAGVYHRVQRGQTLWNISRIYNAELESIVKINNIPDSGKIETGQLILIPIKDYSLPPEEELHQDFIWPLKGRVITGFAGITGGMINKGIDISTGTASNVMASRSGTVIFYSDNFKVYGKTLIIGHPGNFQTVYAGNSEVLVSIGQIVEKGNIIAKISDGRNNVLHFEIRKNGIAQNPNFYLP